MNVNPYFAVIRQTGCFLQPYSSFLILGGAIATNIAIINTIIRAEAMYIAFFPTSGKLSESDLDFSSISSPITMISDLMLFVSSTSSAYS